MFILQIVYVTTAKSLSITLSVNCRLSLKNNPRQAARPKMNLRKWTAKVSNKDK